ncbi:MAG: Hpt domain-containing protein [Telmatospirillum sp.]|nr:Hpt domain-containing protein [Telmatospirillum sp.]
MPAPVVEEPLIDRALVAELSATLGEEAFRSLLDRFLASLPEKIGDLSTSVRLGDLPALARSAHSLRGAALSLGFRRLGECLRELERRAKSGEAVDVELALAERVAASSRQGTADAARDGDGACASASSTITTSI